MSTATATRARIRNFGQDDQRDQFAAKYGSADYETVGRAIAAAQPTRQEATVTEPTEPTVADFVAPNEGSIATLYDLSASRTPWVKAADIAKWLEKASAKDVAEKVDWLETQPVAHRNEVQDDRAWKQEAAAREAEQERQAYEGKMRRDSARVEVPAGRYAVRVEGVVKFYKVDRPTEGRWKGYTFVAAQASDDLHPIRARHAREAVLASIAEAGIEASMALYGRELGKCGHCGRTLTDEESRAYGIGPVCRGKMGF